MDTHNAFKVEDEEGRFSLYRKMQIGRLRIAKGDVSVTAKLIGFVDAGQAEAFPTFEDFIAADSESIHPLTAA